MSHNRHSSRARRVAAALVTSALAGAAVVGVSPAARAHHPGEGTGRIHGTVLETGHVIAPSIDVSLYTAAGEFLHDAVTDSAAGAYSFDGLEAGSYLLWFDNQNEAVGEWWENRPDQDSAVPIVLSEGQVYRADAYLTSVSENLVKPTVTGSASVGSVLTATRGTWFPTAQVGFSYQWLRGDVEIPFADQSTYTLTAADAGAQVAVRVTATVQGATESARSLPTAPVTGGPSPVQTVASTALPVITGSTTAGATLTVSRGTWTPSDAEVTFQWLRGATVVGTGSTYTTTTADVGATLKVRATGAKSGWTSASATSLGHGPVVAEPVDPQVVAPVSTAAPTVTGASVVGGTLVARPGSWSGSPTSYGYRWTRGGVPIAGATGDRLRLLPSHAGAAIGVTVTATNEAGSTSRASAARTVAKAASALAVKVTSPGRKKLSVAVRVTSAGAATGSVVVKVTVGGRTTTKTVALRSGARTVRVTGLRPGKAKVKVTYRGDLSSAAAARTVSARVR